MANIEPARRALIARILEGDGQAPLAERRAAFDNNTMNRLADTFGFSVPGPKAFDAGAKFLLAHGYR
jgi:hypothetical protein